MCHYFTWEVAKWPIKSQVLSHSCQREARVFKEHTGELRDMMVFSLLAVLTKQEVFSSLQHPGPREICIVIGAPMTSTEAATQHTRLIAFQVETGIMFNSNCKSPRFLKPATLPCAGGWRTRTASACTASCSPSPPCSRGQPPPGGLITQSSLCIKGSWQVWQIVAQSLAAGQWPSSPWHPSVRQHPEVPPSLNTSWTACTRGLCVRQLFHILCFRKSSQNHYLLQNHISHKTSQLTAFVPGSARLFSAANIWFLWARPSAKLQKRLSTTEALTPACMQVLRTLCNQSPRDIWTSGSCSRCERCRAAVTSMQPGACAT